MATRKKKVSEERARPIETDYPKTLQTNEYWAKYSCTNCGWSGSIKHKQGMLAPETDVCPTCLCFNAKKDLPVRERAPRVLPGGRPPLPEPPTIPTPIVPRDPIPMPMPFPTPPPYDPWDLPHRPYRPWAEPIRPYFERRQVTGVENDFNNDHCTGMGFEQ